MSASIADDAWFPFVVLPFLVLVVAWIRRVARWYRDRWLLRDFQSAVEKARLNHEREKYRSEEGQ